MKSSKKASVPPSPPPGAPASALPAPTPEQIAALAHAIWRDRGCPEGRDLDHWLEAERQLRGELRAPVARDEIPASNAALDPERALESPVERELDPIATRPDRRSLTSL